MTTSSLIGSFVKRPAVDMAAAGYWVHIEQVLPADDTASLGEVAALVDEIWGTNPCLQNEDQSAEEPAADPAAEAAPPIDEAQFADIVKKYFRFGSCDLNATGDYQTQVKVVVSHPWERYVLRLTNGLATKTVAVEEDIDRTIVVENASSVDLDFPVISGGVFAWRGSVWGAAGNTAGPEIVRSGRTLAWGQPLTGTLTVAYRTRYDLVDVTVFGDLEGEPGECRAICFFHGLVDEIDLQAPPVEEVDEHVIELYRRRYCPDIHWDFAERTYDVTCYEDVSYVIKCQCSGEELGQFTEYRLEVPCPPGIRCQGGWDVCEHFVGHRTELWGYVDCGETSGGLDEPEYRALKCCDSYQPLPKCLTTYSKNPGGVSLPPEVEQELRDTYGDRLRLVPVSPDDGDCGITTTTIEVHPRNCCDVVEPMAWDTETSVEVMAPGTSGIVGVTGGAPPYHWSVRGQGFTLDGYTMRDGYTDTPYVRIYASSIACGFCAIEVSDGCSIVNDGLKSTVGSWVRTAYWNAPYGIDSCPIIGSCPGDVVDTGYGGFSMTTEQNGIRVQQQKYTNASSSGWRFTEAEAQAYCMELYNAGNTDCVAPYQNLCNECFAGPAYVPCQRKDSIGNYDPDILSSCQADQQAWYYYGSGYWWIRVNPVMVLYTYVDQWRC